MSDEETINKPSDFIREAVAEDLKSGRSKLSAHACRLSQMDICTSAM